MVTGSQPVRSRPRLNPAAGLAAAFHGVAFAVLMLAGLGLLLVMLASVILTALGFGVLALAGGLPGDQRILLALLLVGAGLGIAPVHRARHAGGPTRAGQPDPAAGRRVVRRDDRRAVPAADRGRHADEQLSYPERLRWLLGDVATWRDLLWVTVNALVGWILAVAAAALAATGLVAFLVPVVSRMVPPAAFPGNTKPTLAVLGFAMLAAGLAVAPWLLRGYGLLASSMLAPAGKAELALRVRHLAQTRTETLEGGAAEISRIERDLHDGAQARLVAMGMTLDAAGQIIDSNPDAARALLWEARDASVKALAELRALVRGIHPPVLADRGLGDAIAALTLDTPLRIHLASELYGRPPAWVESAAYFAVSELLANVSKHAQARETWIDIRHTDRMLRIGVTDNGHGGADPARRYRAARDRAAAGRVRWRDGHQQPARRPDRGNHGDPVRVVIAEDLFLLRDGLTRMLQAHGLEIIAAVDNGPTCWPRWPRISPDVAIVDVRLPPTFTDEGIRAALAARQDGTGPAGAGSVPVRRAAVRPRAAGQRHRRHRLPAQGPGVRQRPVRRRRPPGRRGRHRHGPGGDRPLARP